MEYTHKHTDKLRKKGKKGGNYLMAISVSETRLRLDQGGTSLAVQWLRLCTSNGVGRGSILGSGTRIPHAMMHGLKKTHKTRPGLAAHSRPDSRLPAVFIWPVT